MAADADKTNAAPRSQLSSSRSPRQWRSFGPSHAIGYAGPLTRRLLTRILAAAREADENEAGLPKNMNPKIHKQASRQSWSGVHGESYDAGSGPC